MNPDLGPGNTSLLECVDVGGYGGFREHLSCLPSFVFTYSLALSSAGPREVSLHARWVITNTKFRNKWMRD